MTTFFSPTLKAFRLSLLSYRAALIPVGSTCIPQRAALHNLRRFPTSNVIVRPGLQPSDEFRDASFRFMTTNHPPDQPLHSTRQVDQDVQSEGEDVAAAEEAALGDASSLTQEQVNAIFRQDIDREGAAELLSRLQKQRRDGTLDERLPYPTQMLDRGLEYLRSHYPVDEEAAIIARLDMELDGHWSLPQMNPEKSPTGFSALEEIRRITKIQRARQAEEMKIEIEKLRVRKLMRERQAEKREAEKAEKAKKGERLLLARGQRAQQGRALASKNEAVTSISKPSERSSGSSKAVALSDANVKRLKRVDGWIRQSNNRVAQLRAEATLQKLPQMTRWQRIWPSGLFTISVVGFALALAHFYIPPSPNARLFPEVSPASSTVGGILALNALLFVMWRVPHAWKLMNLYFMVVPAIPRPFSMLGAEFSHQKWPHITANMLAMWFLGTQLHDDIGRGPFVALVLCGAVIPSFCSLVPHVMMRIMITASLGASGIITTFIGASCILHEGRKITILGLPPQITSWVNSGVLLSLFLLVELVNFSRVGILSKALVNNSRPPIDHLGHLAGYATGISAGCLIRQTSPYWGGLERDSLWRRKDSTVGDKKVEDAVPKTVEANPSTASQTSSDIS